VRKPRDLAAAIKRSLGWTTGSKECLKARSSRGCCSTHGFSRRGWGALVAAAAHACSSPCCAPRDRRITEPALGLSPRPATTVVGWAVLLGGPACLVLCVAGPRRTLLASGSGASSPGSVRISFTAAQPCTGLAGGGAAARRPRSKGSISDAATRPALIAWRRRGSDPRV